MNLRNCFLLCLFAGCFCACGLALSAEDASLLSECIDECDFYCVEDIYSRYSAAATISPIESSVFWENVGDGFLDSSCEASQAFSAEAYMHAGYTLYLSGADFAGFYRRIAGKYSDKIKQSSDPVTLALLSKYAGFFSLKAGDEESADGYFADTVKYLEEAYGMVPEYMIAELSVATYADKDHTTVKERFFPGRDVFIRGSLLMDGFEIDSMMDGYVIDPWGRETILDFAGGAAVFSPRKTGTYRINLTAARKSLPLLFNAEKTIYVRDPYCDLDNVCDADSGEDHLNCPQDCSPPRETGDEKTTPVSRQEELVQGEAAKEKNSVDLTIYLVVGAVFLCVFLYLVYRRFS